MVTLETFERSHLELLGTWLRRPHVAPWFPRPLADLAWAMDPPEGGSHRIIAREGAPVGYLRWQRVDRASLDALGLHEIPANSVDADILLGSDACVGKGLGPSALAVLAAEVRRDPTVPLIGLTTAIENTRARRAFQKAGFRFARQYAPGGLGPCDLMLLDLRDRIPPTRTSA